MQFNCNTLTLPFLLRLRLLLMVATGQREKVALESDFTALVERQRQLIDRLCFAYARSAVEFEDLRQDTLINLWKAMPTFRHQSSEHTWIYRITLNTCVSALRLRSRQAPTTSLQSLYDVIDEPDDKASVIQQLHEAISTLSPLDKSIMLMWLDELPYDEIARITGLPRNTVATRLRRGKQRLRHIIEPEVI
ncbi:MAG: RNA polymerase sigma factor [Muribaculaceae bacterium]|nr:RNA polymerase sigma factor [Muribaculaceae bacterium]